MPKIKQEDVDRYEQLVFVVQLGEELAEVGGANMFNLIEAHAVLDKAIKNLTQFYNGKDEKLQKFAVEVSKDVRMIPFRLQ